MGCCLCKIAAMAVCRWTSTAESPTQWDGHTAKGRHPSPGRRPDFPWPPQAPNINFLHPSILLARMQGVLPLTQRVLGGRVGWPGWGALAKLPTQNPTLTRLQATPSTHGASWYPVYPRITFAHAQCVCSMQNWVRGRSCGRLPLGSYKTG